MDRPHVLVIPYPAQGHVKPLMELSHRLVEYGFKVTFLNTEFNHKRVMAAMSSRGDDKGGKICMAAIPDGFGLEEDRNQHGKLIESMWNNMPGYLEEFIGKMMSDSNESKIKCVITDWTMAWALKVAAKMGIPRAAFWSSSAAILASVLHLPKLIEDKIVNDNGVPYINNQMIKLSPSMPSMSTNQLVWMCMGKTNMQQEVFDLFIRINGTVELIDYFICNSFYELEPSVFELFPNVQPIGPLLASSPGNFWKEDSTCLSWLDQQTSRSVIYVAFGSFTIFNKQQFEELALGLELSGQPFLWVVRPDLTSGEAAVYPEGFIERVASRGRMVSWAPQKNVLAHPSIACFLSHCGWNSTTEGLSVGVPFLCWPYFADQFLNESYICDVWKVGLKLVSDENGVISRDEIKTKVDMLLGDNEIKTNTLKMKEQTMRSVSDDGTSTKNLEEFIQKIKS
ncbi:hypothetical protein Sjap_015443 [Stephania japonica]|uniref:UDP-glycosyltransferase n=1 Tax=Stephania japonica TaxID=461633 RepID=A0AAP0IJ47_9MAGN